MRYLLELGDSMKSGGLSDDGDDDLEMIDDDLKAEDIDDEDEDEDESNPPPGTDGPGLGGLVKPKLEPGVDASGGVSAVVTMPGPTPTPTVGLMVAGGHAPGTMQPVAVTNGAGTGIVWITSAAAPLLGLQQPPPAPPPLYSIKQLNNSQEVANSAHSASSDSNDSSDEKMMITLGTDDQDQSIESN